MRSDFDKKWDAALAQTAGALGRALAPAGAELKRVRVRRREWRVGRFIPSWWKRLV